MGNQLLFGILANLMLILLTIAHRWVTILDGINSTLQSQAPHVSLTYIQGCDRTSKGPSAKAGFAKATAAVAQADAVIYVGGLQASMEEEGTDRVNDMGHPGVQLDLIKALHVAARAKSPPAPLTVVTVSGGPVAVAIDGPKHGSCYCHTSCPDLLDCGEDDSMALNGFELPTSCGSGP